MYVSSTNRSVARNEVQNASATIESQIQKLGDAVVNTLTSGVGVAVGTVSAGAQLGVRAIGNIIDTWI
ncbi:MAG: hypothetical protein H6R19_942 [Proteobacteria bacterium]|nr:hypothetical protein [Pseudomonadota bacterium]